MADQLYDYHIPVNLLPACEEDLLKILRFDTIRSEQDIRVMVQDLLNDANSYMKIRGGYRIFGDTGVSIETDTLICQNVIFNCDTTISQQLQGSSTVILFAVTLGPDFDEWSRNFFSEGDPFAGYVADIIGSIRAENAAEWLSNRILEQVASQDLYCTNRYSPGYCGWDVYEQHKLFSLLPDQFLGITLNPSALMTPIKSVSGVIGAGKHVSKQPHTCAFCTQENCFMRRGKSGVGLAV